MILTRPTYSIAEPNCAYLIAEPTCRPRQSNLCQGLVHAVQPTTCSTCFWKHAHVRKLYSPQHWPDDNVSDHGYIMLTSVRADEANRLSWSMLAVSCCGDADDHAAQVIPRLNPLLPPTESYANEDRGRLLLRLDMYGLQERHVQGDGNCQVCRPRNWLSTHKCHFCDRGGMGSSSRTFDTGGIFATVL